MGAYVKLLVKEGTNLVPRPFTSKPHFSYSCKIGSGYEMGEALSDLVKTWVPASNLLGINLGTNRAYESDSTLITIKK